MSEAPCQALARLANPGEQLPPSSGPPTRSLTSVRISGARSSQQLCQRQEQEQQPGFPKLHDRVQLGLQDTGHRGALADPERRPPERTKTSRKFSPAIG